VIAKDVIANPPLIDLTGVVKRGPGLGPLRIEKLVIERGDRVALEGLDAIAAEVFLNLVTGAALADEGTVCVAGTDTRAIATDTEWLHSLDRFGIVTDRAVLVGSLPVMSNIALPITLSIDPLADDVREQVRQLAADAGLPASRLSEPAGSLDAPGRARVHLARALATKPEVLLLEHPTSQFAGSAAARELGGTLARLADARGVGWVALTNDDAFARASGGVRLVLDGSTGQVRRSGAWWRRLIRALSPPKGS
jgi:predicted ABC-type transport system involved in lysophospholipase L1 biosynthesis ATPase subunit